MSALTPTQNLGLYKANPGTNEPFRTTDVNANWDKVDAALLAPYTDFTANNCNNTATETVVMSGPIPAGAVQGTTWKMELGGVYGHSATSTTLTIRFKLGGTTFSTVTITTPASALSGKAWRAEVMLMCLTNGPTGTWKFTGLAFATINVTDTPFILSNTLTKDTTAQQNLDVTMQWGAANAANVAQTDAGIVYRVTNA